MSDDSDDPVMALLATQRAVLAAVENLANQVEAMQGKVDAMGETLAQLVAGTAGASSAGVGRALTLGDRFRQATDKEAAADPELRAAQGNYMVAQAIAKGLNKSDPDGAARDAARAREWIADQLDRGRVFEPAKVRDGGKGAVAVVEPIHEEMFPGRVRAPRQPDRER
ncbi:MAG TPA: hypothetical protein VF463_21220 [Sphingobium sp.]|uniref:Putative solute carrier organic anion transporter family member 5A1 n=1 Tax=Sphingobium chungbukense TaxID=56193 RepID=G3KB98_9SPHN|nr:hypothetical protein [Sphingobium chungbukense]AEN94385.1 putative solute carrier organic anion transporter family member 5A1 [Sphingobium chungbukense]KKW89298.1 hypothetical protein YP76_26180 [Sphingobium chungbukense]